MPRHLFALAAAVLLAAVPGARSASIEETARKVSADYREAVVNISAVLKIEVSGMGMSGGSQEQQIEILGTVLDTNGLTVVAASALNPVAAVGDVSMNVGGQMQNIRPKGTVSQVKLRMSDGREIEAKQILADSDLDLAFLLPDRKDGVELPAFVCVPLDKATKAEILDEVIGIGRLGKIFNWEASVSLARVGARIRKPRLMYIPSSGSVGGFGTPAFTAGGRALGIVVLRRAPSAAGEGRITGGGSMCILPSDDVLEVAAQAVQAAAEKAKEEKSSEAPGPTTAK